MQLYSPQYIRTYRLKHELEVNMSKNKEHVI